MRNSDSDTVFIISEDVIDECLVDSIEKVSE